MTMLFLMIPNNSGSTLMANILLTSKNCDHVFPLEGQFNPKFKGPRPDKLGVAGLFTEKEEIFSDENYYDWEHNKTIWKSRLDKSITIEKSPSSILRSDMYPKYFPGCKYLIMNRNPIAMAEGVMRQFSNGDATKAIKHAVRCFEVTNNIAKKHSNISLFITYEELTENTEKTLDKIKKFVPELSDIYVPNNKIKNSYSEIKNYNEQQISSLSDIDLSTMKRYWNP